MRVPEMCPPSSEKFCSLKIKTEYSPKYLNYRVTWLPIPERSTFTNYAHFQQNHTHTNYFIKRYQHIDLTSTETVSF